MRTDKNIINKGASSRRFIILVVILLLCSISGFIYFMLSWKSESQKASETVIRQAAARMLHKNTENLTNADYTKITELWLDYEKLSDITLLRKFTNLKKLDLVSTNVVQTATLPKWLAILKKLHLYKKNEKASLDIRILEKLPNLETLTLSGPIANFKVIARLKNLKELNIEKMTLTDIEPIKELKGLKKLELKSLRTFGPESVSLEPISQLSNLQELDIEYMGLLLQLEPVKYLTNLKKLTLILTDIDNSVFDIVSKLKNLQELTIDISSIGMRSSYRINYNSPINIEPIKELSNLQKLWLQGFGYVDSRYMYNSISIYPDNNIFITSEQIEDLQKALPDLKILR